MHLNSVMKKSTVMNCSGQNRCCINSHEAKLKKSCEFLQHIEYPAISRVTKKFGPFFDSFWRNFWQYKIYMLLFLITEKGPRAALWPCLIRSNQVVKRIKQNPIEKYLLLSKSWDTLSGNCTNSTSNVSWVFVVLGY